MAFYRCELGNISRGKDGKGKSSVAAAAYRAGVDLYDERKNDGRGGTHYYHHRKPDVVAETIYEPSKAPEWSTDRETLWNNNERSERYRNARTAKELKLALPYELDNGDIELKNAQEAVKHFAIETIVKPFKVPVDVAFHRYGRKHREGDKEVQEWRDKGLPFITGKEADQAGYDHVRTITNKSGDIVGYKHYAPHAHLLFPLRAFDESTETGFAKKKNRDIDKRQQILNWREGWEKHLNDQFIRMDSDLRVSCKSKDAVKQQAFELDIKAVSAKQEVKRDIAINNPKPDTALSSDYTLPDFSNDYRMQSFQALHKARKIKLEQNSITPLEQACVDDTDRMFQAWARLKQRSEHFNRVYSHQTDFSRVEGYLDKKELERAL